MRAFAGVVFFLFITNIFPQTINLRDTTNQFDYIIITVPEFASACQPLKDHKEQNRNLKTIIVDTTAVFAEFNSDTTRQDDIRRFISYAGTYWQDPKPQFVFLVGNISQIPSFEYSYDYAGQTLTTTTDYFYSQSIFDPDTLKSEFLVGRIPIQLSSDILNYIQKIKKYDNKNTVADYHKILLLSHDDPLFNFFETLEQLSSGFPNFYYKEHFIDDSSNLHFGNKDSISAFINSGGVSSFWVAGFQGDSALFDSNYFNITDISLLTNSQEYFLTFCLLQQHFGTDNRSSILDKLLSSENGAIGGFARTGYYFYTFIKSYFTLIADSLYYSDLYFPELKDFANSYYILTVLTNFWGDPSLKLHPQNLTSVDDDITSIVPKEFSLEQNYPNPFNPSTKIRVEIPGQARNDILVKLKVYDVLGNEVATLVDDFKTAGSYEIEFNAKGLSSGIYFYQLKAGNFVETKKMILLR